VTDEQESDVQGHCLFLGHIR